MKNKMKQKMKRGVIAAVVALIALSANPTAFAQLIQSANGQAQRGATADSTTEITGGAPIKAPNTSIGSGSAQGASAAQQTYEVRLDACPTGYTGGGVERTRKVYTRPNGSLFQEAWYVSKQDCKPIDDGQVANLENIIRVLSDRVVALENKPAPAPSGGATPVFTIRSGSVLGTTENGSITGYCVSNGYAGWSNYREQNIAVDTTFSRPGMQIGPWPNWPGTQVGPRNWVGPLCPGGMGFTQLSYSPQAPTEGE